jgi:two-component system, OmpR family, response regulator
MADNSGNGQDPRRDAPRSGNPAWDDKQVFTTGEAAEICNVSQQTIIRCFDSGRLHGFRVPGSRFRRIPRADLIRFMKANGIPTDILEGGRRRVLIVDDDPHIVDVLNEALSRPPYNERFEVRSAATGYDAGMLTEQLRPHLILLDYMLPDINGNLVCQRIKTNPELRETKVIIISGVVSQQEIDSLGRAGADAFVKKPFNIDELMAKITELIET